MRENEQNPPPTTPDRSGLQAGVDWVGKFWPRVRLAHEGAMVNKIQRQNRSVEVIARNAMTGDPRNTKGLPIEAEGDAMGVDIGDTITNNYPAQKPDGVPTWAKYAAAAALGAGGFVGYNALTDNAPPPAVSDPPVVAEPAGDRWMEYTIEKWAPDADGNPIAVPHVSERVP